eukprot:6478760-Amphidinium_carterae.1
MPSSSDGVCRTDVRGFLMHQRVQVCNGSSGSMLSRDMEAPGLSGPGRTTAKVDTWAGMSGVPGSLSWFSKRRAQVSDC